MQLLAVKTLAAGFAVSMALGGTSTQTPNANVSPVATYPQDKPVVFFEDQSPLAVWIDKLIDLESNGESALKVLDHNGMHSFGCLQFQMSTFKEFGLKYKLISENDDLNELIYDCELQKEIAKQMILENRGNWRRWYTSVAIRGLGLPPKQEQPILFSLK